MNINTIAGLTALLLGLLCCPVASHAQSDSATSLEKAASSLERRVAALENLVKKLSARQFECITKQERAAPSNNFNPHIATPPGYYLVGGSCGFDSWVEGDQPVLIQVGPGINSDGSLTMWRCYAKIPRAITFSATATFCRLTE